MTVRIKNITVKNIGPLDTFTWDLAQFNLVYGGNETGKTMLVEFLIRSLFRHAKTWTLRGKMGQGKVVIDGLGEKAIDFNLGTRKKLEDFWDENEDQMPLNMAQLLVVKGGELEFCPGDHGGVDRTVLKQLISQDVLLDKIRKKISGTVQKATIENKSIKGHNNAEIRTRQDIIDNRRKISELYYKIENDYSQGSINSLENQITSLEAEIDQQQLAKRHLAYLLHMECLNLETESDRLDETELKELDDNFRDHKNLSKEFFQDEKELNQKQEELKDINWLRQAIQDYEDQNLDKLKKVPLAMLIAGLLLLVIGFGFGFLELSVLSILLFTAGFVITGTYILKMRKSVSNADMNENKESIKAGYEKRFGESCQGFTDLKSRFGQMEKDEYFVDSLLPKIAEKKIRLNKLSGDIDNTLLKVVGKTIPPEMWSETINEYSNRKHALVNKIQTIKEELARLGIEQEDYNEKQVDVEYDHQEFQNLNKKLQSLKYKLTHEEDKFESLKKMVCLETGDDFSTPWTELFENLRNLHVEETERYQQTTASIIAGIGVTHVLEEIRQKEDEKIRRDLKSPEIADALRRVTGHYHSLDLDGNQVIVKGEFGDYPLSDLSSGAREQTLLSLRMGFASRLAGGQPLFMILDDAFQYSDWKRRSRLVDTVLGMSKAGWQMIYLTMDDHIRDLICETVGEALGDQFSYMKIDK